MPKHLQLQQFSGKSGASSDKSAGVPIFLNMTVADNVFVLCPVLLPSLLGTVHSQKKWFQKKICDCIDEPNLVQGFFFLAEN